MSSLVTKKDLFWGYLAVVFNVGAGLILMPVILHYLPPEDVGLWFVFITLSSLAQLLEMGFQPTLARNVAYVYAGAQSLNKVGLPDEGQNNGGEINRVLLDALVSAARRVYKLVAIMAALTLFFGGGYYIYKILTPSQDFTIYLLAWLAFSAGYVINFYYGYVNGLLQGRGDISQANKVVVISRCLLIILGAGALILGYGMLGVGFASLMAAIVGRMASYHYFYEKYNLMVSESGESETLNSTKEIISVLWHNASRLGVVQVGAFLIQRANILIASSFLGLAAAASYSMTVTVLMTLSSVAMVICQIQIPYISALQAKGSQKNIVGVYGEILFVGCCAYLLGLFFLIGFGDVILELIGSKTKLLSHGLLFILGFVYLLEINHSIAATYLTTINRVPFVAAALLSGIGIQLVAISTVTSCGVLGLIMAQGVVQLLYNNWKWPLEASKHMQTNFFSLIGHGVHGLRNKLHFRTESG